ncbi:MAG: Na+/H+ antiporter NhaA [Saprospiraceae bacterium]|nr:Na+/H+ antiporter NhaA [Saprospiraceae bacterium]MDZ4705891.1 Na+/H+ antiporter NhaA [Saprospiraceae bacterium]
MMKFEKIDKLLKPFNSFIHRESTAGIFLLVCSVAALVLANSPWSDAYHHLWEYEFSIGFAGHVVSNSLHHWISDGLMAMFFFVVGLELKREIMGGELSSPRNAILPLAAAVGGMVVPALIYAFLNYEKPSISGWGIPMATDIAFALGVLSLLGNRVPLSVKIFLTALAIADDLGAVLVIALFYTSEISTINLATGVVFMIVLVTANYLGVRSTLFYGIVGIGGLWLAFLMSGVHATVAGVLAALTIPARTKIDEVGFARRLRMYVSEFERIPPNYVPLLEPEQLHLVEKIKSLTKAAGTPLQQLEHALHPVVLFVIMPVFALANAGISFEGITFQGVATSVSIGVFLGLLLGKFVGVVGASWLFVKIGWAQLPGDMTFKDICGLAMLAGIGFTMSLFITNLAIESPVVALEAKIGILSASLIAGIAGFLILNKTLPKNGDRNT